MREPKRIMTLYANWTKSSLKELIYLMTTNDFSTIYLGYEISVHTLRKKSQTKVKLNE